MTDLEDDHWTEAWLDRTYGGAPDECSACYRDGTIVKFSDCQTPGHK